MNYLPMPSDFVPKETETIAAIREARLEEKLKKNQLSSQIKRSWWSKGEFEFVGVFLICLLNLYVVYPYLGTEAPQTLFSGPLVPFIAKTIIWLSSFFGSNPIPLPYSIQIVNILFIFFFPVTFYIFVKKITERKFAALITALIVSLPISPFELTRISASLDGRDGPHIAALTIIPLALFTLLIFLREGGVKKLFFAGLTATLVALTSAFGLLVFLILAAITTFSEMLLGSGRLKIGRFLLFLVVTIGFSSFWYNPHFSFSLFFGPIGAEVRNTITRLIPISLFALPILGAFGFLLFDRKPDLQPVFLASFYTIAFAIIVLAGSGLFPSSPSRYIPELGIAASLIVGILILKITEYSKVFYPKLMIIGVLAALVIGILFGSSKIGPGENKVLGLWTGVGKEEIWAARDKYQGAFSYIGYGVSLFTLISLGTLSVIGNKKSEE